MVLSLLTPTGSNFIKDWPSQNTVNCDRIDDYAGPCLPTHPLNTYTPQLIGASSNPNLGVGGFIRGYYYRIFDQIHSWGELRFGTSGISVGSGVWTVTLPFSAESTYGSGNGNPARSYILGNALVVDDSTSAGVQAMTVQLNTPNSIQFMVRLGSGLLTAVASNTIPIAWAINDGILWNARYKKAP